MPDVDDVAIEYMPGMTQKTRITDSALPRDACAIASLLAVVTLAWCAANDRWSWEAWSLPTQYLEKFHHDVLWTLAGMKGVAEGTNLPFVHKSFPRLGAPGVGDWTEWPAIEEFPNLLQGLAGAWLGLFAGLNVSLLAGHLLAAAAFFLAARTLGSARLWAWTGGLCFGLAPHLFEQSPHHCSIAWCWHLPLCVLVWRWVSTQPALAWNSPRFWCAMGIGFLTGLQNVYYTNVFCQLTLLGALLQLWKTRRWATFAAAAAVIVAAATAFALMNVDTWSYQWLHGRNPGAYARTYRMMESHALKLVEWFIPPYSHRSASFARFSHGFRTSASLQDEGSYLGIVGLMALGWLAWRVAAAVVRERAAGIPMAAWQVLWIVLCFSTGGFNPMLGAFFGVMLFRTGCRYGVVVLVLALMDAAHALTAWQSDAPNPESRADRNRAAYGLAAMLCGIVFWDQVPRPPLARQTEAIARQVASDREFTVAMEAALPEAAMVFQLPIMEFPESPVPGLMSYDHFRPYLYSRTLRFSFGTVKGREREAWQRELVGTKLTEAIPEIRRRGFSGLYANRRGFPDEGRQLDEALRSMGCVSTPIVSPLGDLVCYPFIEPRVPPPPE